MKILIAEDERISLLMLEATLKDWGHEVVTATDGMAAWQALQAPDAPRLAILDWEMPGLVGPEVCRLARSLPIRPAPYLLLLTCREGQSNVATALQAGANDYLTKPFDPGELRVRLEVGISLLEMQHLEAASRELERHVQARTAELATAHENTERLLASIPSVLIVLDEAGQVKRWNRRAEEVFARSADEVVGQPFSTVQIGWGAADPHQLFRDWTRNNEQVQLKDVPFDKPDGKGGSLDLFIAPILGERGAVEAELLVLGEDRTEQRFLEAQLAQSQKLESIGQLAAGIAHEINTPIQYVGDNTQFLRTSFAEVQQVLSACQRLVPALREATVSPEQMRQLAELVTQADLDFLGEEIPRAIEQTLEGVGHVASIVRAMKEFSHPGGEEMAAVDLNRVIENTIIVSRNEWKYVAEVITDLDPELPPTSCHPGEISQVLLNLLVNAAHAVGERFAGTPEQKGTIRVSSQRLAGQAEIRVSDNGCGIPAAIQARIFDPFFTTKPVGKGTGQGLSIAHAVIVKKHGGTLTFQSRLGEGTTFVVRLPVEEASSGAW